ncbi:MAG TPA: hypothetical protein VGQ58_04220 [Candidatus Limnocylindrales bacterium]|jgi:hypothetical protein|nr:hypothetical protein [Candidatus Limnocylindrales bacterium]
MTRLTTRGLAKLQGQMTALGPDAAMTESELSREIDKLAIRAGWHLRPKDVDELASLQPGEPVLLPGLVFHPTIMYRSEPGWPDKTLIRRRDRRIIFAECKRQDGKVRPRQAQILELLRAFVLPPEERDAIQAWLGAPQPPEPLHRITAIEVFVWRPSDLPEIERVLR